MFINNMPVIVNVVTVIGVSIFVFEVVLCECVRSCIHVLNTINECKLNAFNTFIMYFFYRSS